ncbi:unnamed protein product [Dovyalis caffra]|uniref:Exostosin GT47 domain-containing protein n=1 Tax=Dovyalis caffra TaxID=77055 RepID=A0AAV1SQC9_9ROSI|nr:unnamed protein product [Dovyalis caffra]
MNQVRQRVNSNGSASGPNSGPPLDGAPIAVVIHQVFIPSDNLYRRRSELVKDISSMKEDWFLDENWSLEDYSTKDSMGDVHHSEAFFLLNYAAMMKDFKIFVYPGGNPTTCYLPKDKLKSKLGSEHYFFMNLIYSRFLTNDPHKAHFFIPISCLKRGGRVFLEP